MKKMIRRKSRKKPLTERMLPLGTPEERVACLERALPLWEERMKELDELFPGLHEDFVNFCNGAKDDLKTLSQEGANPVIIIDALYPSAWWIQNPAKAGAFFEIPLPETLRRLSSSSLWRQGKARLEKAISFLSSLDPDFHVEGLLQTSSAPADQNHLYTILCLADESLKHLRDLIQIIEALGLCKDGWEWEPGSRSATLVRTRKRGIRRSGRGRERRWGIFAALLHQHIKMRTGRAHWARVVRLLHFAGFTDAFPVAIPASWKHLSAHSGGDPTASWSAVSLGVKGAARFSSSEKGRRVVSSILDDIEQKYEVSSGENGQALRTRLIMLMKVYDKEPNYNVDEII